MIRAAVVVVQNATYHTAIVEHGIAAHPGQRKPPLPIDRRGACDRFPGIEDFTLQGPQTPDFAAQILVFAVLSMSRTGLANSPKKWFSQ